MPTIHTDHLALFQILDSSFPSGVFAHSFGLESHIHSGIIHDSDSLRHYLEQVLEWQFLQFELPFGEQLFRYAYENDLTPFLRTESLYMTMQNHKQAEASRNIGQNTIRILKHQISTPFWKTYVDSTEHGCELAVLCAVFGQSQVNATDLLSLWIKKNIMTMAMAAPKISRITPSQIQEILFALDREIVLLFDRLPKKPGNFNPGFEHLFFQHDVMVPKLFQT